MPQPKQNQYQVKRGDTLWHIAKQQYGDPTLWPEIAKANRIPNGNLILIGMRLKLPAVHTHHSVGTHALDRGKAVNPLPSQIARGPIPPSKPFVPIPKPSAVATTTINAGQHSESGHFPVARPVLFPAVKFKLDTLPALTVSTPQADFKLKLIGEITLQQKGTMAEVEYSSSGALSEKLKAEYNSKLVRIADQVKVKWDPASGTAEISCGFTIASKINGTEFVSHQYDFIPPNKFKYTLKPKEISGEVENLIFKGAMGYELEITVRDKQNSGTEPVRFALPSPSRTAVWVAVGGLVALGVVIIVADGAKDVATLGAGAVETPLSWAAAMALFAQASTMAR